MHRILLQIGPVTLYSYGLLVATAFLVSTILILRDSRKFDIAREDVFDCLLAVLIGGIVGGRLLFVILNREYYLDHPLRIVMLQEGGMAFHGALVAAILVAAAVCAIKKVSFWKMSDLMTPYIALGHAIGRIGCLLNGCCYGKVIHSGLGLTFPGEAVMRVPTQFYSSLCLLFIFVALMEFRERRPFDGSVLALYLVLYGVFRFFMDFFRGDNPAVYHGLTLAQIISVFMVLLGFVLYALLRKKS